MSAAELPRSAGFRIRGWHVAAAICSFFGVVIAVDVAFLVLAYRSHPGQISVTPYEDGLLYNRHLGQLEAQARLGWRAAAAARPGAVEFLVKDREGRPVQGLGVTGRLNRPATEAGQIDLEFVEIAPGRYEARVAALTGGWDLSAEARGRGGSVFAAERRLTWP